MVVIVKFIFLICLSFTSLYSLSQRLTNWKWGDEKLVYDQRKDLYVVVMRSIEEDDMISLNVDSIIRIKDRLHVYAEFMPVDSSDVLSLKLFLCKKIKTDSLWGYKALPSLKYDYDTSKRAFIADCPIETPLYLLLRTKSRYTCIQINFTEEKEGDTKH